MLIWLVIFPLKVEQLLTSCPVLLKFTEKLSLKTGFVSPTPHSSRYVSEYPLDSLS